MTEADSTTLIWNHIRDIGTCMMVTYDGDLPRARPMHGIAKPDDNIIWFFTDRGSEKENEVKTVPRACLTYADMKKNNFVSVSGTMTVVRNRALLEELWNDGVEFYYPNGKSDPSIVLLRFEPEFGEYWDSPSSPILLAIKFVQSKISGERPALGTTGTATFA